MTAAVGVLGLIGDAFGLGSAIAAAAKRDPSVVRIAQAERTKRAALRMLADEIDDWQDAVEDAARHTERADRWKRRMESHHAATRTGPAESARSKAAYHETKARGAQQIADGQLRLILAMLTPEEGAEVIRLCIPGTTPIVSQPESTGSDSADSDSASSSTPSRSG